MICSKCGTEISNGGKFCPNCGEPVPAASGGTKNLFSKHPTLIFSALAVVAAAIIIAIFKYMALFPIIILLVLFAVIMINRRILRKIRGKDSQEIAQCALADNEIDKLSQYFVNRDEKYISSLGNGYIMNYLASGSLSRGFAVISSKRVYFRGSCFSGQGKSLVRTDEERTVDIKDVTGSGFIYRRYIGVLSGLFVALAVLLCGIAGNISFLLDNWHKTISYQNKANELQNIINDINIGANDTKISNFNEQIAENQISIENLQAELQEELSQALTEALTESINGMDSLTGTDLNIAYGEYLYELYEIADKSETTSLLCDLYEKICSDYNRYFNSLRDLCSYNPYEEEYVQTFEPFLIKTGIPYGYHDINDYIDFCSESLDLHATIKPAMVTTDVPLPSVYMFYGNIPLRLIVLSYQSVDCNTITDIYDLWDDIGGMQRSDVADILNASIPAEDMEACRMAYKHFLEKVAPDYLDSETSPTWAEVAINYLTLHPDPSFANITDFSAEYDSRISKLNKEIDDLNNSNLAIEAEIEKCNSLPNVLSKYEQDYAFYTRRASSSFTVTSLAAVIAGLLVTFLISCFLVFLNYLKKRKTMFQIQYAGGCIAFNVSYYAKAEIDDFQKQLRRAKDFVEESAAKITSSESPVQPSVQNSVPDDLRKYADLLKEGLISQEEYDAMKKKILNL